MLDEIKERKIPETAFEFVNLEFLNVNPDRSQLEQIQERPVSL